MPNARIMKAFKFNTIYWEHLRDRGDTARPPEDRRVIPLAGDNAKAKSVVANLIEAIGFAPLDLGPLRDGGRQMQPDAPIYNKDWTLAEARRHLGLEAG